ncbi:NAD(P)H-dependent glycerol-3-phosphate dehydrogenase [Temperatibacter marinus]
MVRANRETLLWAREEEVVETINTHHENTLFLKGVALDPKLKATGLLEDLSECDAILMVSPAQHLRSSVISLKPYLKTDCPLIICSKGIEVTTGKLMSDVMAEVAPKQPFAILSGPTFAAEVVRGQFSAITLACEDEKLGNDLMDAIGTVNFRPYLSTDVIGSQIGGAVKNVLAIATGIAAGLDMGENTRAAVITRGLAEMVRFAASYGAENDTLMGLSGLGDLLLTCSSTQSRNMSLGKALGEGQTFSDYMADKLSVAEGAHTVKILHKIAVDRKISMPITEAVYRIIVDGEPVSDVFDELVNRPFTREDE